MGAGDRMELMTIPASLVDKTVEKTSILGKAAMEQVRELWITCSEAVRASVGDTTYRTTFAGIEAVSLDSDTLVLNIPNGLIKDRLTRRYQDLLEEIVAEVSGKELAVELKINPDGQSTSAEDHDEPHDAAIQRTKQRRSASSHSSNQQSMFSGNDPRPATTNGVSIGVDPRYTFDSFVIGASNRFAHAAARSVAEQPAQSYNPLFIHGDAGLGKTHLLHAIGNYVAENYPHLGVRYVSTETFLNEFVDAIRKNGTGSFKKKYRECDILLVDDVQFLESRESLQEEFFHTFNSIYAAKGQIVLTSDRPPRALATLEDRLRSRFMSGLITDVQPPEIETRLAILRKKADENHYYLPDDVAEFIASSARDNIRELEGALIRVSAFASLNGTSMDLSLAKEILSDIAGGDGEANITPKLILDQTAKYFNCSIFALQDTSRKKPIVTARQIAMYVFRELTDLSFPAIGKEFGGRDHTTVMHAVDKIERLMGEQRDTYRHVTELSSLVRSAAAAR